MTLLTDTHVHFDDDRFDQDRDTVYSNAIAAGINRLIIPAVSADRWQKIFDLCNQYPGVFPTAGLHPVFIHQHKEDDLQTLDTALSQNACIAVGECGLDGFVKSLDYERQQYFFEQQLIIAAKHQLPTIVHARNAVQDVIQAIKKYGANTIGVIHSYNGSLEQAQQLIDLGYLLSFGGAITYERATRLRKIVKALPLESMMVETDAPDQPGSQYSGTRNEPAYLNEVVNTIAELKNLEPDIVREHSNNNANRLFKLLQS